MTALPEISSHAMARSRWQPSEIVFWILALACAFLFPSRYLIMTDIVRLAFFALSLNLILGYAGILSLGQATFFGFWPYLSRLLGRTAIITESVVARAFTRVLAIRPCS